LLPLVTCFNEDYTRSVYGHIVLERAIADLKAEAGNFQQACDDHIRSFINDIYAPLRGNRKYFLDKTPRYYLIAEDLHRLFPEAKFIYLFRNPLDIYDSVIEAFCNDNLRALPGHYMDVTEGFNLLCKSFERYRNNAMGITYEDLCADSENIARKICGYLEIGYHPEMLTHFSEIRFSGTLGDRKRDQFNNIRHTQTLKPISAARRLLYANWLARTSVQTMSISGYRHEDLAEKLKSRPKASLLKQIDDLVALASFRRQSRLANRAMRFVGKQSRYGDFFF